MMQNAKILLGTALIASLPLLSTSCALDSGSDEDDGALTNELTNDASVQITIDESKSTSLEPGFVGYNSALVWGGVSYLDHHLQSLAAPLGIGWLRYPAGTGSDAFDWSTGQVRQDMVQRFAGTSHHSDFVREQGVVAGRGGHLSGLRVDDMDALIGAVDAEGIIVCVNGFTDTPASAGAFAAYAKSHGIRVLAWELSNEPYYFPSFFKNAKDYLDKMKPYRNAIKAADPDAVVSVFASDAGKPSSAWDSTLGSYSPKYWDAVTVHHYPKIKGLPSTEAVIEALDQELASRTTVYVNGYFSHTIGNKPILITEFDPSTGDGKGGVVGTLYGGIYAAEYALRMARAPQVKHVGAHQVVGNAGVDMIDNHASDLQTASRDGKTIDTTTLDFGFFVSAQATAYGVAAVATKGADSVLSTTVTGGGKARLPGGKSMPAVYAQAFKSGGETRLVLTNKGAQQETVAITDMAHAAAGTLHMVTVTGPDRLARNSRDASPVTAITANVSTTVVKTVALPPYSVVSVTW